MSREIKYAAGAAGIVALLGVAAYAVANNKLSWGTSKVCAPWLRNGPVALVGDSIGVGMEKPLRAAVSPAPLTAIPKGGHAANQTLQRVKENPKILESDLIFVSLGSNDYAGAPNAKAIHELIDLLVSDRAHVIWVLPPNILLNPPPPPATREKQDEFLRILHEDPHVRAGEVTLWTPSDAVRHEFWQFDRIHLTPKGDTLLAQEVADWARHPCLLM